MGDFHARKWLLVATTMCAACTQFGAGASSSDGTGPAQTAEAPLDAGADTAPPPAPVADAASDAPPTARPRTIFLTSELFSPGYELRGVADADAACNAEAAASTNDAVRAAHFTAWLSVYATSAEARIAHGGVGFVNTHGDVVAASWTDLTDGAIAAPISWDANGKNVTYGTAAVWTATDPSGSYLDADCGPTWTSSSPDTNAVVGDATRTDESWSGTGATRKTCDGAAHFYCVEN